VLESLRETGTCQLLCCVQLDVAVRSVVVERLRDWYLPLTLLCRSAGRGGEERGGVETERLVLATYFAVFSWTWR